MHLSTGLKYKWGNKMMASHWENNKILFVKVLFFLIAAAVNFSHTAAAACNYNGECGAGEDQDSCVFDCMIAANTKYVKLHLSAGPTNKVTHY